jgi:hypothetical protein
MTIKEIRLYEAMNGFRLQVTYLSNQEEEYVFKTIEDVNVWLQDTFKRKEIKETKPKKV